MGVQPPQGGTDDDAEQIEFGIADLEKRLDDANVQFPASASEIVRELSNPEIPCDPSGRSVKLATAFEELEETQFESKNGCLNRLHPIFEDVRTSPGGGMLGWVRSLFGR